MPRTRAAVTIFYLLYKRCVIGPALALCLVPVCVAQAFTVRDALSAPFSNGLVAAPTGARVAWVTDAEGLRNVWIAGPHEPAQQVTHYGADDGQDIDALAWSSDGQRLAWTRGTGAQGPEHPVANPAELPGPVHQVVQVADLRTHVVRTVAEGHAPLFSSDGTTVYFLRRGNIWAADLAHAGTTSPADPITLRQDEAPAPGVRQLLFVRGDASGLRLSPNGTQLLFVSARGDHTFIGVYTFATGALQWMDPGVDLDHDAVWSPDGKSIAFIREVPVVSPIADRWLREGAPWSIRIADATTGQGREAWRATPGPGSIFHAITAHDQIFWMRDGQIVFSWESGGWTRLYALPPTGPAQLLTPGDLEVDAATTDGNELVWSDNAADHDARDADRRHLSAMFPARDHRVLRLTSGQGIETLPALMADGSLACMSGDFAHPLVPVQLADHGSLRELAPSLVPRSFPTAHFVLPRQVVFPAADGLPIHGQLFLPANAAPGARLPAVVFFHGGPRRQMLLGFHPMQYYAQAYEFNQFLASQGFAVLSVNYRSGTGYGLNFRQALNYGANGASEYNDVLGAASYLASRPDIDPKRIGAWGGSYGGYLTALALARSSNLYAAGVDLHGVHDWSLELDLWKPTDETSAEPGLEQSSIARRAFLSSPMADVDRWTSPVLLMQGDDDRNVLFTQTVRLAAALRARHVPVEVQVFPDEVHDFLLHRTWLVAYERSVAFLLHRLATP